MILLIRKKVIRITAVIFAICVIGMGLYQYVDGFRQSHAVLAQQVAISSVEEQLLSIEEETKKVEMENTLAGLKTEWRMQREKAQDQWEYLLVHAEDGTIRKNAQQQLYDAIAERTIEVQSEQLLAAKNYHDAMVMIAEGQLTAILGEKFTERDGVIVAEMLERNTGFDPKNIVVILKSGT